MKYDFDKVINRIGTNTAKWDEVEMKFGTKDVLPMWVADMDFRIAQPIIDALKERAEHGIFGYTKMSDSYKEAVCSWMEKRHEWKIEKDWVIHSPGVVPALSIIVKEFTKPGDKIIIQTPVYYPFFDVVRDNNRELICNSVKFENEKYVMDYEDLESKIDENVKMMILCSPHNPIGRVWSKEELVKLGEICMKHNIMVVSDEIHADLVYKGHKHIPFASISEEFAQNSITCFAPSKTFNIAGLQSALLSIPNKEYYDKFSLALGALDIRRDNCFGAVATETAYTEGEEWLEQLLDYLEGNLEFLTEYCEERIPKIKVNKTEGTYLVWLDCHELGMSKEELGDFMIKEAKVALDHGYWFGPEGEGFARINIACPRATLEEGLKRIENAVNRL
ncbi:pyridoxal phosphate-dependent aminotransferase [Clostridium aestuarii]|uniref:cysteine-S-conjugate beta-lyase n=1 Tax=Clostridium aestuarii TaxID=338193 RepID=A0ABT4D219_9CLOT|nr:MalY/PatB family protein [Clostridium aestuarii]MCY6484073.1 pyridoxal phosphate-dependent aminotransferase [Clostridium aestuarii]